MKNGIEQHQLRSGRIVTADEWLQWRKNGLNAHQIAHILSVSPGHVYRIARKFMAAGYQDPARWRNKLGPPQDIDTTTDTGGYLLGILWGSMSVHAKEYWVSHRDPFFIQTIREHLHISAEGYAPKADQMRLKISRKADIDTIEGLIIPHGWRRRTAAERPYPSGNVHHRGFIRAWVELHSTADFRSVRRRGRLYRQRRLIIYGNWSLLEEMNYIISSATGLIPRTLQHIKKNDITKALYYHASSVAIVVSWLYEGAELWNPASKRKLEFID